MKKLTLLPVLCLLIALSACHLVDDDVELPEPEKPVNERILGNWHNYATVHGEDTVSNGFQMFEIEPESIDVLTNEEGVNRENYDYSFVLRGDKTYITTDGFIGVENFQILSLTDSTMTWVDAEERFLPEPDFSPGEKTVLLFRRTDWKFGDPWE